MNVTENCNFVSVNAVLNFAVATNENVTAIIAQCPSICGLAWGFGNPDLSGIGAFISYIWQTGLTVLLGPLLVLGPVLARFCKISLITDKRFKVVRLLHSEFHGTSLLFSIPVAVAAIVRVHQGATFFEISFMQSLLTMQFLSSWSDILAMGNIIGTIYTNNAAAAKKPKQPGKPWDRIAVMRFVFRGLCFCGQLSLYSIFMSLFNVSSKSYGMETEVFHACPNYGGLDPLVTVDRLNPKGFFKQLLEFLLDSLVSQGGIINIIIDIAVIVGIIFAIVAIFLKPFLGGPASLGLCGGAIYYTVDLNRKRLVLKALAGAEYQDDQWGFGQVIALCIWVPFLVKCLEILFDREVSEDKASDIEEVADLPPIRYVLGDTPRKFKPDFYEDADECILKVGDGNQPTLTEKNSSESIVDEKIAQKLAKKHQSSFYKLSTRLIVENLDLKPH